MPTRFTILALISFFIHTVDAEEQKDRQPTRFGWNYTYNDPEAGTRVWMRNGTTWIERYESGATKTLRVVGRDSVEGVSGTIVQAADDRGLQIFIPDLGSPKMWLWFRRDRGKWSFMAEIKRAE